MADLSPRSDVLSDDGLENPSPDSVVPPEQVERAEDEEQKEIEQALAFRRQWQSKKKHVFIFSNAGKPIFSRYGNESDIADFFGVMQALVAFVIDSNDMIQYMVAGKHKIVFSLHGPLYFVMVACTNEPYQCLHKQLNMLHSQVIYHLTGSGVANIFKRQAGYDLRNLLGGTDITVRSLIDNMNGGPGHMLGPAIQVLRLPKATRSIIHDALSTAQCGSQIFAIMFTGPYLVQMVNNCNDSLSPYDLFLLMNHIMSSQAIRSAATHAPICLPKYSDKGMLYAFIDFIHTRKKLDGTTDGICVVLISMNQDVPTYVSEASDAVNIIKDNLGSRNLLNTILDAAEKPLSITEINVGELRHTIYKICSTPQFFTTQFSTPYADDRKEQKRLLRLYATVRQSALSTRSKEKVVFRNALTEAIYCAITPEYELYCTFDPMTDKAQVANGVKRIQNWEKKNEDNLFIKWD